jgi:hypothetical protein
MRNSNFLDSDRYGYRWPSRVKDKTNFVFLDSGDGESGWVDGSEKAHSFLEVTKFTKSP